MSSENSDRAFHGLSPAEAERLYYLIEECGEVIKTASKVLRHGYASYNPDDPRAGDNRDQLQAEIGDAIAAMRLMVRCRDVDDVLDAQVQQHQRPWFYHQLPSVFAAEGDKG